MWLSFLLPLRHTSACSIAAAVASIVPGRAVENGTASQTSHASANHSTISPTSRQPFRIADLLHPGAENACGSLFFCHSVTPPPVRLPPLWPRSPRLGGGGSGHSGHVLTCPFGCIRRRGRTAIGHIEAHTVPALEPRRFPKLPGGQSGLPPLRLNFQPQLPV